LDLLTPTGGAAANDWARYNVEHFDPGNADTSGRLVLVPLVCPMTYDHKVKHNESIVGMDIRDQDFVMGTPLEAWFTCVKWTLENNNGQCLKTASNFFDVASLNVTVAGGTAVDQALLANTCNFSTLVTPFVCNATSGHTAALQRAYDKITVACMQAGISTSETPPDAAPAIGGRQVHYADRAAYEPESCGFQVEEPSHFGQPRQGQPSRAAST
jgi:hypothetical protein